MNVNLLKHQQNTFKTAAQWIILDLHFSILTTWVEDRLQDVYLSIPQYTVFKCGFLQM